jgi:hypothetical protein
VNLPMFPGEHAVVRRVAGQREALVALHDEVWDGERVCRLDAW